jgi:phosphoesterase RecJ-like protein
VIVQVAKMLADAQRVLVVSHRDPDGDALGSSLGLMHLLRAAGKKVFVHSEGPLPEEYLFLPGMGDMTNGLPPAEEIDLAVVLDCHQPERTGPAAGEMLRKLPRTAVVDHHQGQAGFGQAAWVDPAYAATSEMLVFLARQAGLPLDPQAATCFFVGVQTDTGSFRYSNTTPRLLRVAADLVEAGAEPWRISQEVYATRPKRLRLLGRVLESLTLEAHGRLAVAQATLADLKAVGCGPDDLEETVENLRGIPGVEVGMLLREMDEGGVRISLRARGNLDVAQIALSLGGGGHRNAAGLRLADDLAECRRKLTELIAARLEGVA